MVVAFEADLARLYRDVLGREPDLAGGIHNLRLLQSGQVTLAQMKTALQNSPEAQRGAVLQKTTFAPVSDTGYVTPQEIQIRELPVIRYELESISAPIDIKETPTQTMIRAQPEVKQPVAMTYLEQGPTLAGDPGGITTRVSSMEEELIRINTALERAKGNVAGPAYPEVATISINHKPPPTPTNEASTLIIALVAVALILAVIGLK